MSRQHHPVKAPTYSQEDMDKALTAAEEAGKQYAQVQGNIQNIAREVLDILNGVHEGMYRANPYEVNPAMFNEWTREVELVMGKLKAFEAPTGSSVDGS